jgi:hypothetical protein
MSNKTQKTKHKQDYFRKSFFNRTAEHWNSLPSNLKACDLFALFKTKLTHSYLAKLAFLTRV